MAQYEKLINLSLLSQFLTKAKTVFAPKITASGILKGDGNGGVSAATAGTDYVTPAQSLALGLTGASVGDLVRVNAVDSNGKPTSWEKVALNEIKCNKNLLDNWYFVGGGSQLGDGVFPINQRGQATYSGAVYGIDRWKQNTNNSVTVLSDGIVFTSLGSTSRGFSQRIENPQKLAGKTVTLSALIVSVDGDGVIGSTISDTNVAVSEPGLVKKTFVIPVDIQTLEINGNAGANGHTIKIAAVKLELGSEQTLAHNEGTEQNPVWVLNEIPDYGEELRKCRRYYLPRCGRFCNAYYYGNGTGDIAILASMSKLPNVSVSVYDAIIRSSDNAIIGLNGATFACRAVDTTTVIVRFTKDMGTQSFSGITANVHMNLEVD